MTKVGWGCCVGTLEKFERNSKTWGPGPIRFLEDQTSISRAYNQVLDEFSHSGYDVVVLVHDDLEVTDYRFQTKVLRALRDPDVALVGVAGGGDGGGTTLAWWEHDPVGHQQTDQVFIDFGQREGEVDLLEGSVLVFSPWAVDHLRFDEALEGFHGYDEVAAQGRAAGKRCVVVDADTHHHTHLGFKSPESQREWERGVTHYRSKWEGKL